MLLFLVGLFLLQTLVAQGAELKIGFVNTAKILGEAPQSAEASKRLQREFGPREKGLVDAQKALSELEQKLGRDQATMSESQRRNLERDILNQRRDLQRSTEEFRQDVNLRRNEELGKFQRQILEVVNGLAKEEGFDLILNDSAVIFASQQVDVTDKVLKRLGVKK
jgi:outer membrane protein